MTQQEKHIAELERENAAWKEFADKVDYIIHADYTAEQLKYRDIRFEFEKTKRLTRVQSREAINPFGEKGE